MKRAIVMTCVICAFCSGTVYAQGFKEVITKMQSLERDIDALRTKQESDVRTLETSLASAVKTARSPEQAPSKAQVDNRVEEIRVEMSRLAAELNDLRDGVGTLREDMAKSREPEISSEMIAELDALIERIGGKLDETPAPSAQTSFAALTSGGDAQPKLTFKPYGFFKLDMSYDTAKTNSGNYVFWVNDTKGGDEDNEFNMTARQTRLGVDIAYDGLNDVKVSGKFEADFYGAGTENKNIPMMRHAFMKVDFGRYYLLAGQASDVISPLNPATVNYTVLWNCGNIGYRRPQLQFGTVTSKGLEVVWALARNIPGDVDGDGIDDGADSGLPAVQARLSYLATGLNVGVSGHYGKNDYTDVSGKDKDYSTYSVNAHVSYTLNSAVSLNGEVFHGSVLGQHLGGIGQGFDFASEEAIESTGGWVAGTLKAKPGLTFNCGFGTDMPDKDDARAFPARNLNQCVYANMFKTIAHNTSAALELSHWTTGYYDAAGDETDVSDFRAQAAFIFSF